VLDRINQFISIVFDTFRQFGQGKAWLLLLIVAVANWIVLYAHYDFISPLFYGIISAWLSVVPTFGEAERQAFEHYPQHLYYLGDAFGWAKLLVGLILEGLILGAAARVLARRYYVELPKKSALASYGHLVIAWLVINALMVAAGWFLPQLLEPFLQGPRRVLAFSFVFLPFGLLVVLAPLFVAIPSVAVYAESWFKAIWR
jgi:hypothetical protein